MQLETGADTSIYRGLMMNPAKAHVEASLGRHVTDRNILVIYLCLDVEILDYFIYF